MPKRKAFVTAAALLAVSVSQLALSEDDGPDISGWECEFCAFETGLDGSFGIGVGLVFDNAYRFGTGTGLEDDGAFANGDFGLTWWGDGAAYYELYGDDLGTRARDVFFEGGVQGRYQVRLGWDETPYRFNNTGATIFTGVGSASLGLPSGWVTAGNAALFPALQDALSPLAIGSDRKTLSAGLSFLPSERWLTEVDFRREDREGVQPFSGSFLTHSAILPAPIDYSTDILEARIAYTADTWQASLGYYGSSFNNDDPLLSWDNPFTPIVAGASAGTAARPPDNDFHQVMMAGNYRWGSGAVVTGHLGIGKATQDETFAPYTVNSFITTSALPANNLDGRVDSTTLNGGVRLNVRLNRDISAKAWYRRHERDNKTPQLDLTPVTTDIYAENLRQNLPFSFEKSEYGVDLRGRLPARLTVSGGYEREDYQRDFQEVRETSEDTFYGRLTGPLGPRASISVSAKRQDRDGSGYRPVTTAGLPENPLLRKYNMADRERDQIAAELSLNLHAAADLTLGAYYASDEYPRSVLGLNESNDRYYTLDLAVNPLSRLTINGFLTRQWVDYTQSGQQGGGLNPIWTARGEDRFITGGATVGLISEDGMRRLALEYVRSDSRGAGSIETASGTPVFPDLTSDLETLALDLRVRFRDDLSARFRYLYERYHSRDWTYESLTPATLGNVLTFGEDLPNYTQQILWFGLVRQF